MVRMLAPISKAMLAVVLSSTPIFAQDAEDTGPGAGGTTTADRDTAAGDRMTADRADEDDGPDLGWLGLLGLLGLAGLMRKDRHRDHDRTDRPAHR